MENLRYKIMNRYITHRNQPDVLDKVPGLVEVLGADGVMLDELHVVILGDVALAVVAYSVHHGYPEVLDGPQKVLMTWIFSPKIEISRLLKMACVIDIPCTQ